MQIGFDRVLNHGTNWLNNGCCVCHWECNKQRFNAVSDNTIIINCAIWPKERTVQCQIINKIEMEFYFGRHASFCELRLRNATQHLVMLKTQRNACCFVNPLFGPMVHHMSLSNTLMNWKYCTIYLFTFLTLFSYCFGYS